MQTSSPHWVFLLVGLLLGLTGCTDVGPGRAHPPGGKKQDRPGAPGAICDFVGQAQKGLARAERKGRWGYVDSARRIKIPFNYQWAESFSEGMAAVKRDNRWGYIDRTGKVVIAFSYHDAGRFSGGLAAVKPKSGPDTGWSYIDRRGKLVLRGPFEAAEPFRCGLARVKFRKFRLVPEGPDMAKPYTADSSTYGMQEQEIDEIEAAMNEDPHKKATLSPGMARVDRYAWPRRYRHEAARSKFQDPTSPSYTALQLDAQWQEHVWKTIDRQGRVTEPSTKRCAAGPEQKPKPRVGL